MYRLLTILFFRYGPHRFLAAPGYAKSKHLTTDKVTFFLEELGVNCTIGHVQDPFGQYTIKLDDIEFDDLP